MAASGTGSLEFIDDATADKSTRLKVFQPILCPHIQPDASELSGWCFTVQLENGLKHLQNGFFEAKKWNYMQWPSQSPDLKPTVCVFHLLKGKIPQEQAGTKDSCSVLPGVRPSIWWYLCVPDFRL